MKPNNKNKYKHYGSGHFYAKNRIPFPALSQSWKRASLTVEASLVLPIFLFAMILIGCMGLLIRCQDEMQWNLTRIAREASAEYGARESKACKNVLYYKTKLMTYMEGSGFSVSFQDSRLLKENEEIDLVADYRVKLPFSFFSFNNCLFRQRVHTRAFVGVETRDSAGQEDNHIVYVAATGKVYHERLDCTYLKLSISQVKYGDLESLRNQGGGKYKTCEKCCKNREFISTDPVWITNYGDRFHSSSSCSGIRRSIQEMKRSEVGNRTPCSKCGKE